MAGLLLLPPPATAWAEGAQLNRRPSPQEGLRPAPTQSRQRAGVRGPVARRTKPLTLTLSQREGRRRPPPTPRTVAVRLSRQRGQTRAQRNTPAASRRARSAPVSPRISWNT